MSLFKHAFARGINDELVRLGHVRYATKEAADETADAVGDMMPQEPAAQEVPPEVVADVATTLIDAANKLVAHTGVGEEPTMEEHALKTSAAQDLGTRAAEQAYSVMVKAAELAKVALGDTGSTILGGDKGNQMADATAAETIMEARNRPEGVHVTGVGNTEYPVGQGAVGSEQPHPKMPAEHPGGSNSVIEQSQKGASLRQLIQKVAMGSTIVGGDKGNTLTQAAKVTGEAALALKNQPMGYAEHSVGTTELKVPATAVVGTEMNHPKMPGEHPAGTNSVMEHSKVGAANPFMALFQKTAEEVVPFIPQNWSEDTKIAHVRRMMGMTAPERNEYIALMYKEAGATDDVVLAITQAFRNKLAEGAVEKEPTSSLQNLISGTDSTEKKETPAEEKKEEKEEKKEEAKDEGEKKEGSADLLSRIRQITLGA